jgi:serine/threonine protein kinase
MGSVYLAEDQKLDNRKTAIKTIPDILFANERAIRNLKREAVVAMELAHPNIVTLRGFEHTPDVAFLIMDYIEGEDLQERLERIGPFDEEEVVFVGASICDALSYMHSKDPVVLHRDIKPANVRITPNGAVYLVDFGLAKVMHGNQTTTTGARAMTMGFSPPEQYGAARTDARTDIYSLGATLYTALTGFTPEDSLAQTMDQEDLTPVRERNPKISKRVAEAVERALQVHPNDRWQMAAEFKNELLKAQSGRFNLNFSLDQSGLLGANKKDSGQAPKKVSREIQTKKITKERQEKPPDRSPKQITPAEPVLEIDRGGCLALLALLAFILLLAGAVFSLLYPALAKNLIQFIFN